MKSLPVLFLAVLILTLSSCGVNSALFVNQNQTNTQVVLSSNNFKVLEHVTGTAKVWYVYGIGGVYRKQLFENAYTDMLNNAKLINSSKALINIVTEQHIGGVPPFYYKRTVTVSGTVIEFTK